MFSQSRRNWKPRPFTWPAVMMTDARTQKGRAVVLMGVALGLTLVALGWFAWAIISSYQYVNSGDVVVDKIESLKAEVKYLDEALTMSARMAAATGDPKWERRYEKFDPQLTHAIEEMRRLEPAVSSQLNSTQMDGVNRKLVRIERESFALVHEGRLKEAQGLLAGPEYAELKREYAAHLDDMDRLTDRLLEQEVGRQRRNVQAGVAGLAMLVPLLLVSWWMMTLSAREWERTIEERSKSLTLSNRELQIAKELADDANNSKSWFLSRMSHELRTPLNAIIGFGQFLEDSELDERQRKDVKQIVVCSHHLLGLINEILDISRLEVGSSSVSLEKVDVNEVCEEVVSLMAPLAREKDVSLILDARSQFYAIADRRRLSQILINLVSNAIKYNVRGGTATVRVASEEGRRLSFEVRDTGIGMSKAVVERLFTPFERFGAHKKGIEGSGLGLLLTRALVRSLGGQLDVSSIEGEGTRVTFNLVHHVEQSAPVLEAPMPVGEQRPTVLLIEDNPLSAELMTLVLAERPECRVVRANQGSEGLELLKTEQPAVVFLDLHLPDISGQYILASMLSNPATKDTPVIVVSAEQDTDVLEGLVKSGAFACVTKPISVPAVLEALDRALESRKAAA